MRWRRQDRPAGAEAGGAVEQAAVAELPLPRPMKEAEELLQTRPAEAKRRLEAAPAPRFAVCR